MIKLSIERLNELANEIAGMDNSKLDAFGTTISLSDIATDQKNTLYDTIQNRRNYLNSEDVSGLVINGEISAEETRDD